MDTITTTDSLADFTLDYEPVEVTSIEEQVGEPDALIEDDPNFVDIKGVLSPEQAEAAVEDIITRSDDPVVFDEKLIPIGVVAEPTPDMSETEVRRL